MERESRTYQFTFGKGDQTIIFDQSGTTPCFARQHAFEQLEEALKQLDISERRDWRLLSQRPYLNGVLI